MSSITAFDPIAFIQGINSSITAGNQAASSSQTDSTTSGTDSSSTNATNPASIISPTILSLLENDNSNSANGNSLSTLLGQGGNGVSPSDPLAGVYNTLLYNVSTVQPYQNAAADTAQAQAATAAQNSPVQNILNSYTTATNAYNQTLLQNAQAVAAANNFQADGKTPLVA